MTTSRRLAARRAVIDTFANEPIHSLDRHAPPGDASGKDNGACPDEVTAIEKDFAGNRLDTSNGAGHQDLCPKPSRLPESAGLTFHVTRDEFACMTDITTTQAWMV